MSRTVQQIADETQDLTRFQLCQKIAEAEAERERTDAMTAASFRMLRERVETMTAEVQAHKRDLDYYKYDATTFRAERDDARVYAGLQKQALDTVMVGGNHLASYLIGELGPSFCDEVPHTMPHDQARELLPLGTYEVWCCWAAIMRARNSLPPMESEMGQRDCPACKGSGEMPHTYTLPGTADESEETTIDCARCNGTGEWRCCGAADPGCTTWEGSCQNPANYPPPKVENAIGTLQIKEGAGSTPARSQRPGGTGEGFDSPVVDSGEPKARLGTADKAAAESVASATYIFKNELGSIVKIAALRRPNGVAIWIIGPNSESTNEVTLIEARQLHRALGGVLWPKAPDERRLIPLHGCIDGIELRDRPGERFTLYRDGREVRVLSVFEDEFVRSAIAYGSALHAIGIIQSFFDKHALGPLAAPSCLVCGRADTIEWPSPGPAIQHAELPGIVVCFPCRDAATKAENSQVTGNGAKT